jgi:hypothetical protein
VTPCSDTWLQLEEAGPDLPFIQPRTWVLHRKPDPGTRVVPPLLRVHA